MNKTGPIIIIDDDRDDQELVRELFSELKLRNEVFIFTDGEAALEYLSSPDVHPFLIISDIKMPKMDGYELRQILFTRSNGQNFIPFLLFTNGGTPQSLNYAYSLSIQGIFQKPIRYAEWKQTMENILQYWSSCMSSDY
jgi:CheY-like chemotaxis protein